MQIRFIGISWSDMLYKFKKLSMQPVLNVHENKCNLGINKNNVKRL